MNATPVGAVAYRHVACCIDSSDESHAALEVAAEICSLTHGRLRVVHVAPSTGSHPHLSASDPQSTVVSRDAHRPDWELLTKAMRRVRGEPVLLEGSPAAAVACSWAGEEGVDLLVAAAHRGPLARIAVGSFAGYLAQRAPCSALLVRPLGDSGDREGSGTRHVACFVDGSVASQVAIDEAHALAGTLGARLSVVHVSASAFALPLSWEVLPPARYSSAIHTWLTTQTVDRVRAEPVALEGFGQAPALACDWAEHEGVDLVVAAAHGGLPARVALGSFTRYLTYHASSSVLVARSGASSASDSDTSTEDQRSTAAPRSSPEVGEPAGNHASLRSADAL